MSEAMQRPFQSPGAPALAANGAPLRFTPGPDELRLPTCEDEPVSQNTRQLVAIVDCFDSLQRHWRGRPDVFVGADQFLYWDPAYDPRAKRGNPPMAPDVYVACGVANRHRNSYVVWEEGKPPDFVLEVASPSSRKRDAREKPGIYAKIGVPEFFLYDPEGKLTPRWPASRCAGARTSRCRRSGCRGARWACTATCLGFACVRNRPAPGRSTAPCAGTTRRPARSCQLASKWPTTCAALPTPIAKPRPRWRSWRRRSRRCEAARRHGRRACPNWPLCIRDAPM